MRNPDTVPMGVGQAHGTVESPKVYNQGVMNQMTLPINADYIAVGIAIGDLLKEGWKWEGIKCNMEVFEIVLTRDWRC